MDVWNSLLGCSIGLVGAFVIAAYTRLNSRMRAKGARAHWAAGALTGSLGMASIFCGWALLGLAEPVFRTPWLQIPGGAACLLALAVYAVSARQVGRLRGPTHYSLDLKTSGIYNRVRHPQALALCILAVGWALLSGSLPFLLTVPLWIGFWIAYTYLEEKCELIPAFGEKYLRYKNETPRILPRLFSRGPLLAHPRNAAGASGDRA